jgi:hypothetical protein
MFQESEEHLAHLQTVLPIFQESEEHLAHLQTVLPIFQEHQMTVSASLHFKHRITDMVLLSLLAKDTVA